MSPRGRPGAVAQALSQPSPALEVRAAAPEPGAPAAVTFDEALGLTARSPAVVGAEAAAEAQRRAADAVSALVANPTLNLQPGVGRDPATGDLAFQGEATLLQGWNLAGLPGARKAAVRAEGEALAAQARAAALSHRLAAAQAWVELWAAQQVLADARQERDLAAEFTARMARAAAAAAFTRAEAADAATYAAEARVNAIVAEGDVTDRGYLLAAAMGLRAPEPVAAAGPLPSPPVPYRVGWADLVAAADGLPAVAALRLAADADRAREAEVRSAKGLGLGTGVKATRDPAGGQGLLAVLELSLPLFDRGEREAAPLAGVAARGEGESRQASAQAATELARALHEVEHTGEILEVVEKELLPAAAESARLRQASLQAGETTVLEVLVVRRAWAVARAKGTRAVASHAWAKVKLWLLLSTLDAQQGGKP